MCVSVCIAENACQYELFCLCFCVCLFLVCCCVRVTHPNGWHLTLPTRVASLRAPTYPTSSGLVRAPNTSRRSARCPPVLSVTPPPSPPPLYHTLGAYRARTPMSRRRLCVCVCWERGALCRASTGGRAGA